MKQVAVALAAIMLLAACADQSTGIGNEADVVGRNGTPAADYAAGHHTGPELAALRHATAPFHLLATAQEAGYTVVVAHPQNGRTCLRDPILGAMGVHYLNPQLVTASPTVAKPPVVIYQPERNCRMRLVAVEYIVPYTIRPPDADPPTLFGQQFKHNEVFQLWALHAWVWDHNPSGMFADWNPRVSCQYAPELPLR